MEEYKKNTIKAYDLDAPLLAKKFKDFSKAKRDEFEIFINLLKGKHILDLGCGAGIDSAFFLSKGLKVTSVDLSERMIELCKKKGVEAKKMDIEALDFKKESFIGIWAVTSLLHIKKENLPKVIRELYQLLEQEGILYVCVKKGEGEEIMGDGRYFAYYQKEELIKKFRMFELIEFREVKFKGRVFLEVFFKKK